MTAALAPPSAARAPTGDTIIDVQHLGLRFGGVVSLQDVSLSQARGEILAVIGPNGAGKTSLFNCLTGEYSPQDGTVLFHPAGRPPVNVVGRKPYQVNRLGIARTFQASRLFNALSAFENVKIGAESRQRTGPVSAMLHLPWARREDRESDKVALELLRFVGLAQRANEAAASLAYGEQRRLEVARALATGPQLLLLDEPAAGTNPTEKTELAQVIRHVNKSLAVSVLLIEHDMGLVMSLADRIVVLNFGRVIASGAPEVVRQDPAVIEAYLGAPEEPPPGGGSAGRGDGTGGPG
jgi:branched-chain amino acid transport system ATP-binding protein